MLVTGGSRGIGAAVAVLAARNGFDVAVNYREDERAASAIVEAVRSSGVRGLAIKADVAVEADVVRMFEAVDTFGPLKALVNNAGITGGFARVADLNGPALERMLAVNVTGAILCAREAVRRLSTVSVSYTHLECAAEGSKIVKRIQGSPGEAKGVLRKPDQFLAAAEHSIALIMIERPAVGPDEARAAG